VQGFQAYLYDSSWCMLRQRRTNNKTSFTTPSNIRCPLHSQLSFSAELGILTSYRNVTVSCITCKRYTSTKMSSATLRIMACLSGPTYDSYSRQCEICLYNTNTQKILVTWSISLVLKSTLKTHCGRDDLPKHQTQVRIPPTREYSTAMF
jgi:hypothetical protein